MSAPSQPTGGQILVDSLIQHGITDIFLIPGIQLDWAVDALRQRQDAIRLFVPRHEQSTTYMADGYYRASGRVGTAMVVPGPGALNAGAGLATAYAANSKVLFVAGQVHAGGVGKGYGLLHEIKDQTGFVAGLTKAHHFVHSADQIASSMAQAFAHLQSGRPRPVGVEVPHNYLSTRLAAMPDTTPLPAEPTVEPDRQSLEQAARLLNEARLPVVYVGGGIVSANAGDALRELAEKIGAPVVMSDNGRGALSDRHPLAMNSLAGRAVFQHADVVLVIGSRFMDSLTPTASWTAPGVRYIYLNIDAADLSAPRTPEVAIVADAALALPALTDRLQPRQALSTSQLQAVQQWANDQIAQVQPQASFITAIRDTMADDAIFVNELTQVGYLARVAFPVYAPRTYIGPGYQGTLGYAFPTALGAAVAAGGKRVVAVSGDGGFGWSLQELATARRYQLPVTLIVFNDGHYGNVRAIQKREFGAEVAVELTNPDFDLLTRAFGVDYARADTPDALRGALRSANGQAGPALIEVKLGEMPSPWHLLRLQPMAGMGSQTAPANPLGAPRA